MGDWVYVCVSVRSSTLSDSSLVSIYFIGTTIKMNEDRSLKSFLNSMIASSDSVEHFAVL